MATPELQQFLAVLRGGNREAVEKALCDLDPFLRRIIHLRLIDGRLRHVLDTADIFQSLLKDFMSQEHPQVETSAGLCAYLAVAVRHKIQTRARKERRHAGSLPEDWEPVCPERPAGRQVEDQDFSQAIRTRLSREKRLLFDLKLQGLTWTEIAGRVGGQADALRMRLSRAVATVLSELGHKKLSHAH